MIHQSELEHYSGSMEELAIEIGNLRYDTLSRFLELLANKIEEDGKKDQQRNRVKLAKNLFNSADQLKRSKQYIDEAWLICKPFTD